MKDLYPENWPQFYTATIEGWKDLLKENTYKDVIVNSLKHLVENKKIKVNAFVIMNNHVDFIWQAMHGYNLNDLQTSFKKHTSKEFLKLSVDDKNSTQYEVALPDRKHHFWKRNSLGVELFTESVFIQKLNYIHENPVKAGVCLYPEDYKYSSPLFYLKGIDDFNFIEYYTNKIYSLFGRQVEDHASACDLIDCFLSVTNTSVGLNPKN